MRGQAKTVKSIIINGNVYLKHRDDEVIAEPKLGDIYLYLNDEETLYPIILNDYQIKNYKGYFKAKIFDGKNWCMLDCLDFFANKENYFTKSEICDFTFQNCQEILAGYNDTKVYRSYREHYTTYLHQENDYKGKKNIKHK